jgi:hypothetical protein
MGWGLTASALAHVAFLVFLGTPSPRPGAAVQPTAARAHITWLSLAPAARSERQGVGTPRPATIAVAPAAGGAPQKVVARKASPRLPAARPATDTPTPAAPAVSPPEVPAVPPRPVAGVAFAPAAIGWGGASPRGPWTPSPTQVSVAPVPPPELALQEAARSHIALALHQQLGRLPAPSSDVPGRCAPPGQGEVPLACDSEALQQAVSADAQALARLLKAYRSADPRVSEVALAYVDGRYRLELR